MTLKQVVEKWNEERKQYWEKSRLELGIEPLISALNKEVEKERFELQKIVRQDSFRDTYNYINKFANRLIGKEAEQ